MRDFKKDLELCEKATSGPWKYANTVNMGHVLQMPYINIHGQKVMAIILKEWTPLENIKDNLEFIVQAREGWPEAIKRVMELEAEVKRLKAEKEELAREIKVLKAKIDKIKGFER